MARECETAVKCRECNSDRHVSAMHPGPAPWAEGASSNRARARRGVRRRRIIRSYLQCVQKFCVKLQDLNHAPKSVWLMFFPSDCPEQSERMYVVLDDQSKRSLAKSAFFKLFGINGDLYPYTLHTCAGNIKGNGKKSGQFHC